MAVVRDEPTEPLKAVVITVNPGQQVPAFSINAISGHKLVLRGIKASWDKTLGLADPAGNVILLVSKDDGPAFHPEGWAVSALDIISDEIYPLEYEAERSIKIEIQNQAAVAYPVKVVALFKQVPLGA